MLAGVSMPGKEFDEYELPRLPDEPEGWRELQKKARNAQSLKELDAILAEMNRLLAECEKKAAAAEAPPASTQPGEENEKRTTGEK